MSITTAIHPHDHAIDAPDVIGAVTGWLRRALGLSQPEVAVREIDPETTTLVVHVISRMELRSLPGVECVIVDGANKGRAAVTDATGQAIFHDLTRAEEWPTLTLFKIDYETAHRFIDLGTFRTANLVINLDPIFTVKESVAA